jgi:ATP-dependent Clp protease ATP-binding subunit ClpC
VPSYERYTDRATKVLELSLREALQLGHNYIGPEHILLGLIREGESVAAQVLKDFGGLGGADTVRRAVIKKLAGEVKPSIEERLARLEQILEGGESDAVAH